MPKRAPGISYRKRVAAINRIYEEQSCRGIPNREIWRRFIYPVYGVSERTFYNLLKATPAPAPRYGGQPTLFDSGDTTGNNDTE